MAQNYVLLETIQLTQPVSSIVFDNLPSSGYTDLKIVASARGASAFATMQLYMRFNGVSSGYTAKQLYGDAGGGASTASLDVSGTAISIVNMNTNQSSSNVFSSTDIYIPNYRSANYKSVSVDSATENNASGGALMGITAGLWSNSAAITSITFTNQSADTFLADSTFSLYGLAASGTTPAIAPYAQGGDIVANDGTYWYHAFLSSGTFTPGKALTCNILQIAGGGGGGYAGAGGGGGGAGGLLYFTNQSLSAQNYSCVVGAGGPGASTDNTAYGAQGNSSQFASLTASIGGGWGSSSIAVPGRVGGDGGSGGGAAAGNNNTSYGQAGGAATSGQGYAGGASTPSHGGGGGGASQAGADGTTGKGGDGVNTYSAWATATNTGVSGYYAGGGGGSFYPSGYGAGGAGGGGTAGQYSASTTLSTDGVKGTGGGGAAGAYANNASGNSIGRSGGSGIIIIRYAM